MAKSRTLRSSVKPNSEFDRVISGMRSIDEVELHTRIVIPLLRALGAEAVTYVHGAFERGKDIIYVRKDSFYGDSSLEVCQVKNQRFSGNATSSNNTIGVLTQLEQARKTKVLNPLTSKKELPNAVVLLTTYDLPDKDVADCDTYLDSLSAKRIKVIGPEKLVELLRTNLFEEYIRFASDGDVAAQSMYVYVNTRHESAAFDSSHRRDLESFFINLGIAAPDSVLSRIDNGTLTPAPSWRTSSWFQEIRSNQYRQVHSLQAVIDPCVRLPELLVLEKFGKATQTEGPRTTPSRSRRSTRSGKLEYGNGGYRTISDLQVQKFVARLRDWLEKQINTIKASTTNEREASESFAAHAIGIIADSNRLLTAVESIFGEHAFLRQEPLSSSDRTARLQIPDLPPGALLHLTDSICVLGDAGAGKTSVARKLTREALNRGIKVVYFPCLRIQDTLGSPLRDEIANFVAGISGVSSTIASKAVGSARLIVLDGCDEAATFQTTLQDDIAKLAFAGRIDVQVPTAADGSWDQIVIPEENGSRITYDTRKHMLSFIAPVGSSEFNRILRLNIGTIFEKPLRDAYGVHKARDPLLAVTCRESAEIRLPHAFLRLRLEPFTDVQMHLFFQRWLHRTGFSAEPILQLLNQNANLREICRTPIIASIVAGLHEGGSDLPRSRTEVYQKRFELLLRRWDAVKQVRRQTVVRPEDKLRFLAEVAFHVHSKHHRVFTSSDAKEVWNQSLAVAYENVDFNDVMVEIQRVHDVAPYQGRGEYSLGHLSFQEYLCAYNCVNRQRSVFLIKHLGDPWWRRVCVIFVGITGDASPFMDAIVGSVELFANRDFLHKLRSEAAFTSKAALDFLHDSSDSDGEDSTYNDTHENLKSGSKIEDGEDAWDTGIDDDLELDADSLGEDDDVP